MRYLKVTARWESSAVVEAGDIDTSNAELVDWTAREVARP
jgi:hypothetical protein